MRFQLIDMHNTYDQKSMHGSSSVSNSPANIVDPRSFAAVPQIRESYGAWDRGSLFLWWSRRTLLLTGPYMVTAQNPDLGVPR